MRAIAVRKFGDVPELMDLPPPEAGPGEIKVRLGAAGVNPFDWKIADGALKDARPHVFPLILGVDGAGVVEAVGSGVSRFVVGDGVYGQFLHSPVGIGTYAEFVTAPETIGVSKTPRGIYTAQAAAVPTSGMTALQSLDELGVRKSQTLLVLGAAGGVGSFAVQLAAGMGVHVIASARGNSRDFTRKLGAVEYFDSASPTFLEEMRYAHPGGIDAIFDVATRGPEFESHLPLVRPGGVVASTIGAADSANLASRGLRGINVDMHPTPALLNRLSAELGTGRVRVAIESQVPLVDAPAAVALSRAGKSHGKTVLTI